MPAKIRALANISCFVLKWIYKSVIVCAWGIIAFLPMDAIDSNLTISNDYFDFPLSFTIPSPAKYKEADSDLAKFYQFDSAAIISLDIFAKRLVAEGLDCFIYLDPQVSFGKISAKYFGFSKGPPRELKCMATYEIKTPVLPEHWSVTREQTIRRSKAGPLQLHYEYGLSISGCAFEIALLTIFGSLWVLGIFVIYHGHYGNPGNAEASI
jgi:hypothetical protein